MTLRARISTFALLAAVFGAAQASSAQAEQQVYIYQVEHPTYGKIGTYRNTVAQTGDSVDVQTQLHVTVKMLGIPLFRQDADRLEHWENGRLVSFKGDTDDNGKKINIDGKAQGEAFVILSPLGTFNAPARVHPSNPWAAQSLSTDTMMSTKTGRVMKVVVTDTGEASVTLDGQTMKLHQFFVDGEKHQVVWLDQNGIVAAFQTEEDGSPITFVLQHEATAAAQPIPTPVPLMQATNTP